jgi:pimeloyl-ACP methyl ester carboxylesterase
MWWTVLVVIAVVLVLGGAALGLYAWNNTTYARRDLRRVRRAGFRGRRVSLPSGTDLHLVEGPDNGPPIMLLHGHGAAWNSYARALPRLAADFHVHVVDVAGHGVSARTPGRYDVHHLGRDAVDLIREVIGEPVILSGHSSGGLIAAWFATAAPELVRGVVFEDPPFFSTDPERMPQQFNYVDLAAPAHEFLQQETVGDAAPRDSAAGDVAPGDTACHDFPSWYIAHNGWLGYFGRGREGIVKQAVSYQRKHPDRPLSLWFLPPGTNESFAYMHLFDPVFADAFYTLDWQSGFDQAETLARVVAPSVSSTRPAATGGSPRPGGGTVGPGACELADHRRRGPPGGDDR